MQWYCIIVMGIYLITNEVENLFISFLVIWIFIFVKHLLRSFALVFKINFIEA